MQKYRFVIKKKKDRTYPLGFGEKGAFHRGAGSSLEPEVEFVMTTAKLDQKLLHLRVHHFHTLCWPIHLYWPTLLLCNLR